jgi:DNA-binding NtrC family response regulator
MAPDIIIAEDEPALRELLLEAASGAGLRAIGAEDGQDAFEKLEARPGVQLLVSGVRMPRMNGYELTEKAITRLPNLKVVMMTG